jgi:hypothetical protein
VPERSTSRKQAYATEVARPSSTPRRGSATVRLTAQRPRDERDAEQQDRDRGDQPGVRALPEQPPRDHRDHQHLQVAEDGREAGADGVDRVVPQDEVAGEEHPGERRRRPGADGQPPERAALRPASSASTGRASRHRYSAAEDGGTSASRTRGPEKRDAARPEQRGQDRAASEGGHAAPPGVVRGLRC